MRSSRPFVAAVVGSLLLAACGGSATESVSETTPAGAPSSAAPAAVESPATDGPATDTPAADAATPATDAAPVTAPATPSAPPAETPDVVVPAALQFSAPLVGGGELDATTLAGKPTVFWFWAPT